jgi:flavin-dependent dehydrogenase
MNGSARQVLVIGGGPAGSVAATLLARGGVGVTLIEQSRFPRDKVCGESLSALGMEVLERLGFGCRVKAAGAVELRRTGLYPPSGAGATLALPRPMWGISRRVMDALLLDVARDAGVVVQQPARCERLIPTMVRCLESNAVRELRADVVVLADGKGALLAAKPQPTGDLGVKGHFVGAAAPRDAVELYGVSGHYIGVAAIDEGRWNVAMNVPAARVARCGGDLDHLWRELLAENRTLAARFGGAARIGEWLASPLPRFGVVRKWPTGVIPIGNAVAALEPIGGEGMGLAMRSAELAANAILAGEVSAAKLQREFARLWGVRRTACRGLAKLLGSPALARDVVEWAGGSEGVSRVVMSLIGK